MIKQNPDVEGSKIKPGDGKKKLNSQPKGFIKLQEQEYSTQKIRMDGNCLFKSVAHQLTDTDQYYAIYRELAVAHIKSNESTFKGFIGEEFDGGFSVG